MILFFNFTPFTFGGGAERWMMDVSSAVNKLESAYLVDVHASISNLYGRLVLKNKFNKRLNVETNSNVTNHISLSFLSFIPFTSAFRQANTAFKDARLIYIRYELLEIAIVFYIGGASALRKTIAGIHSPFVYRNPITFFDRLHNLVYSSTISAWVLLQMTKVHAINNQDYKLFTKKLNLKNVVHVPNFIDIKNNFRNKRKARNDTTLNITFIGELNLRKGVDILIETIKKSSNNSVFHIAGDGVMKKEIVQLQALHNVNYHGYLDKEDLRQLYSNSDVLFLPSRAESFSLASLEGMSYGLPLISSSDTSIGLPSFIQVINTTGTPKEYITIFKKILKKKKWGRLNNQKKEIKEYTKKNFSRDIVLPKLFSEIFEVKIQ